MGQIHIRTEGCVKLNLQLPNNKKSCVQVTSGQWGNYQLKANTQRHKKVDKKRHNKQIIFTVCKLTILKSYMFCLYPCRFDTLV